ncbi:N-acetylmuramoyl-L-alanine amidase [Acetobacteraceae bacterium]|nr:N-acetylmuramoyl-L-alanine amidase [Acetobacteraceae bacterium]
MESRSISRRNIIRSGGLVCGAGVVSSLFLPSQVFAAPYVMKKPQKELPLVVIDPGHGGKDPGAIGITGIYEKHVVEAVAQDLRLALIKSGKCRADLTRRTDSFISLNDRVGIAQEKKASLLISLHADSFKSPKIRGASVYTKGKTSDPLTLSIVRNENAADRFGKSHMKGVDSDVMNILTSMVGDRARKSSAHIASAVVKSFQGKTPLLESPMRHAGFFVLKSREIPSVLVEMGFLSNHQDELALKNRLHRGILVSQLAKAVNNYVVWQKVEGYSV